MDQRNSFFIVQDISSSGDRFADMTDQELAQRALPTENGGLGDEEAMKALERRVGQ
jgi:hypothetical protein